MTMEVFVPADLASDNGLMDFTLDKTQIRFKIDDDVFTLLEDVPAELLIIFTDRIDKFEDVSVPADQKAQMLRELFQIVLTADSAERFNARMRDPAKPIGMKHIQRVLPWIMEQFGLRPTQPSESSSPSDVNPDPGTNSTDDSSPEALTSESSASTDSSTSSTT